MEHLCGDFSNMIKLISTCWTITVEFDDTMVSSRSDKVGVSLFVLQTTFKTMIFDYLI